MRNKMYVLALVMVVGIMVVSHAVFAQAQTGTKAALAKQQGCSMMAAKSDSCCNMTGTSGQCACQKAGKACDGKCKTAGKASAAIQQKSCPVTGEPINTSVYTDYNGKRIYFCCAACVQKFLKSPEQYLKNL